MNGKRLVVGLILLTLCVICFIQPALLGCSNNSGDESASDPESTEGTFFSGTAGNNSDIPDKWEPVSDKVMVQIKDMYAATGIDINCIDRNENGSHMVRCRLAGRNEVPVNKQLLDGLYILYNTFPDQKGYVVILDGAGSNWIETGWDDLVAIADHGYSYDCEPEVAESVWHSVFGGELEDAPVGISVDTSEN